MSEQKNRTITDLICRQDAIDALSRGAGCGNVCRNAIERIPSVPGYAAKMNLNDEVKVKLTVLGIRAYIDYMDSANKKGKPPVFKPADCIPGIDSEGYTTFHLWELFRIFGQYIYMGCDPVFENLTIVMYRPENVSEGKLERWDDWHGGPSDT